MELKVLFLDIDNTLLDFNAAAEESMKHCFRMFELEYQPEMFSVFQEENNKIWRKIEKRELKVADLRTVRWQTILKKLGLEADGAAMEDEFKKSLHESAVPGWPRTRLSPVQDSGAGRYGEATMRRAR